MTTLEQVERKFIGSYQSAKPRTAGEKLGESVSILDFKEVYNTGRECSAGINAALLELSGETIAGIPLPLAVRFPRGLYYHADPIWYYTRQWLYGDGVGATRFHRVPGGTVAGYSFTNVHPNNPNWETNILFGVSGMTIDGNASEVAPTESFSESFLATDYGGIRLSVVKGGGTISTANPDLELTDARQILHDVLVWDVGGCGVYISGNSGSLVSNVWTQRSRRWGFFVDTNDAHYQNIDCAAANWGSLFCNGDNNEFGNIKTWFSGRSFTYWDAAKSYLSGLGAEDADGYTSNFSDRLFNDRNAGAGFVCRGSYNRLNGCNSQDTAGHGFVFHTENSFAPALTGDQIGQIDPYLTDGGNPGFLALGNTDTYGCLVSQNTNGFVHYSGGERGDISSHLYNNDATCFTMVEGDVATTDDGAVGQRSTAANAINMFVNGQLWLATVDPEVAGMLYNASGTPTISTGPA